MTKGAARLSDESVANALGWTRHPNIATGGDFWVDSKGERTSDDYSPPRFTVSLDAIVAELDRLHFNYSLHVKGLVVFATVNTTPYTQADTAPLALCAALLAYLKEPKNA